MDTNYDAIVIGARCAGAPTAMLLARSGHKVLLVDRATFPSDTLSTHMIHLPGVAALKQWGLLDTLVATGCPPIGRYRFDFGPFSVVGRPQSVDGLTDAYAPRRTILDKILVNAAVASGVKLREAFTVDELIIEDGEVRGIRGRGSDGKSVVERARVIIGADGRHSLVARAVRAERYNEKPPLEAAYFAYWSGFPTPGFETWIRPHRSFAAIATHNGLACVVVSWPNAEFDTVRSDAARNYLQTAELVPELAERLRGARRESRFFGTADLPNFFRRPFGPGWALVGDAGYHKDPITAQGISDAFRDAELLSAGLDDWLNGRRAFDDAMAGYQRARDEAAMPIYELTLQFASLEPPPPEMQQLFAAMAGNQAAMDGFAGVAAGTVPVHEFFAPQNVERILREGGVGVPA